ncbi:hypothetical protein DICA0_E36246 [Diutina catenulata]
MGSGGTVKIDIDRNATDGTFTNHDVVRGVVRLAVTDSISLTSIEVKLEGISRSQLRVPEPKRKKNDKERLRTLVDVHKVLFESQVVFPPQNVRQVSTAREYTLTPGNYTYPFEFTIPLDNDCVKVSGISNKVSFNKKNMDVVFNNGNFNQKFLMNKAKSYLNSAMDGSGTPGAPAPVQNYHVTTQLPPSLSGMDDFASVKYFVKVTCKRSSIFKQNLRSYDPFVFLPLDLEIARQPPPGVVEEEYREVFVRKEIVFRDRIPDIVGIKVDQPRRSSASSGASSGSIGRSAPPKRGLFKKMFDPVGSPQPNNHHYSAPKSDPYQIDAKNVPFGFEVRFRHPAFLIPDKPPSFRLYLISKYKPSRYQLEYGAPGESSGLGVVYLQKLKMDLVCTTTVSVLEDFVNDREIHTGSHETTIPICTNLYQNLTFDLAAARPQPRASASTQQGGGSVYEIEIPQKYFKNAVLPEHLSPSFRTCNISRKYALVITAGLSSEQVTNFKDQREFDTKVKMVELVCPNIKVLSGLSLTSTLHSNASKSSLPRDTPPPMPERPMSEKQQLAQQDEKQSSAQLPTYDDVVREASYQDDSEHQRARRRYRQHAMYYQNLDD